MSDFFDVPEIRRCTSPVGDCVTNNPRHTILQATYSINDYDRSELYCGHSNAVSDSFEQTISQSSLSSQKTEEPSQSSVSGYKHDCLSRRRDTLTLEDFGAMNARENELTKPNVLNQRPASIGSNLLALQVPQIEHNVLMQDLTVTDSGFAGCNSVDPASMSSISCPTESPTHLISPRHFTQDARTEEQSDGQSPSALKAVELHQELTRLRALFETLQYERQDLEIQLERTKELKEGLLERAREARPTKDAVNQSDEQTKLAELHCLLTKESARTSSLLVEISLMRKRLELDDVRRKFEQLQDEAALRCCDFVDSGRQSHEVQLAILSVVTDDAAQREISAELPSASLQTLLDAKERLREVYAAQIETAVESLREKQRGLNYRLPFLTGDFPPKTYQNLDHSTRLKVLKFGLEERLRHLADAKRKSKVLEDQLETIKTQQNVSKIETIRRLFALSKTRREHIDVLRQEIRQHLQTMQTITPAIRQDSKEHIFQMAQNMTRLKNQIWEAKSEVAQLKQNPVLRLQQLESSIFALKTAITNSEARQLATKVDIRSGVKQFKKLSCDNERLKKQVAELGLLNNQLSAVYSRLDDAERLKKRTLEMLSDQNRRVDDAKAKLELLAEIHANEEKSQLDLVLQIEHEKEEYERRLMETNQTLSRLHRQVFFATTGTKPRVHFETQDDIYRSEVIHSDDFETDVNPEVTFGKRCAFYCHEITRLRQRTTCLEESLHEVTTQKLTPARLNEIKALLRVTQQPNPNVARRPKRGNTQTRPLSMTAIDLPMRKLQLGKVLDTRKRSQCNLDRSHSEMTVRKVPPLVRRPTVPSVKSKAVVVAASSARDRLARSKSFPETQRVESYNARHETGTLSQRPIFRPAATSGNTFSAFRSTKVQPRSQHGL